MEESNLLKRKAEDDGDDGTGGPSKKQRPNEAQTPSRVIHVRNLPHECRDDELYTLGGVAGRVVRVLVIGQKGQGFIEMESVQQAEALVNHYNVYPAMVGGRTVYLQYSQRDTIDKPEQSASNRILLCTITNMAYPVTIDILQTIFIKYGVVEKIVMFTNKKNEFQVLVQMADPTCAANAKFSLDRQCIFGGGYCVLSIVYSTLGDVTVKYNNDRSRDFTNPNLPTGGGAGPNATQVPSIVGSQWPGGLGGGAAGGSSYGGPSMYGSGSSSFGGGAQGYGMGGASGSGLGVPGQGGSSVLLVNNLDQERVTPDILFVLFGVYGDVQRVKILYNKRSTALVQMADGHQAYLARTHLNEAPLFGQKLNVTISKNDYVNVSGNVDQELTRDYHDSPLHRFKSANSKNFAHITSPCTTLHLSNLAPNTEEQTIRDLFSQYGTVEGFRFFVNDTRMALVLMGTVEQAVHALIALHSFQLNGKSIRVGFSKSQFHKN